MKDSLEQALVSRFPSLYRDCYTDPKTSAMSWGFECGDGWYGIIYNLSLGLEGLQKDRPDLDIVAEQVKEKFGTMRFYTNSDHDPEVRELTDLAEHQTAITCEECGTIGTMWRRRGWIRTLCDNHAQEFQYEEKLERIIR